MQDLYIYRLPLFVFASRKQIPVKKKRGSKQMISLQGKARFAAILLFVFLAVNFMAAQKIRDGAEGSEDRVPDGQHSIDGQKTLPAKPSGGAVVQGNGINYHGGPVLH